MTAVEQVPDLVTPTWDYAPAPEARDLATIRGSYGLFIGGEFVDPADGGSFATISPSTVSSGWTAIATWTRVQPVSVTRTSTASSTAAFERAFQGAFVRRRGTSAVLGNGMAVIVPPGTDRPRVTPGRVSGDPLRDPAGAAAAAGRGRRTGAGHR